MPELEKITFPELVQQLSVLSARIGEAAAAYAALKKRLEESEPEILARMLHWHLSLDDNDSEAGGTFEGVDIELLTGLATAIGNHKATELRTLVEQLNKVSTKMWQLVSGK